MPLKSKGKICWLWKQSRANQAPPKFPAYQGINREFSAFLPIFAQTGGE
jgi:hypothetical protein